MIKKRYFKSSQEYEVTFRLEDVAADEVMLLTESNGWKPTPMEQLKSGPFQTKLRLPAGGQMQFRYLLDGERWMNDEAADAYLPNEFGGENSVVITAVNGN